ncbi:MAG TPA: TadE/TadG family type IV pilus assembly protein [Candidatus Limnocylindria bacterium]|nr:TadE/TadG family type IV pilus assembly protein [Candidatus Limnocylindria bacterium]
MIEFALVLPILALLLVMALDFGRVFFGWIAVQNAARIAADFAAGNSSTWDTDDSQLYQRLVIDDMEGINCAPPPPDADGQWDIADIPDPAFIDTNGNGDTMDDGDHVQVTLDCEFDVITPLAGAIVGSPVDLSATATFAINQILVPAIPTPEPTPPGPCPDPIALFSVEEQPPDGNPTDGRHTSPVTIQFTDESTDDPDCDIDTWEWKFGAAPGPTGTPATSTDQNPEVDFTWAGSGGFTNYVVTLTVTSTEEGETATATKTIRVDKP